MKIGICGCGITGTTIGFLLAEQGHDVTIHERAEQCTAVGAGILLQPSGQGVLKELGLLERIRRDSESLNGFQAIKQNGKTLVELSYESRSANPPARMGLGVHRGLLFEALLQRCKESGVQIINSSEVTNLEKVGSHFALQLKHGDLTDEFDFVIAADGSRSALRNSTPGIKQVSISYDYAALWTTGPCDYQPKKLVQFVKGTHTLVGLLPIGRGHSSFFWGLSTDAYARLNDSELGAWKEQVLATCPPADSIIEPIQSFDELTFARYQHVIMRKNYSDGIVFLGDAAHGTSPHLGQGVNLGLEDALCFSNALAVEQNFETACKRFRRERHRKLRYYQQLTRILTPFFQSDGFIKGALRDTFLPWFPKIPLVKGEMLRTLCGTKNGWLG